MRKEIEALSHDVRSPLAVIVATAASLRDSLPEAARPGIDKILSEARRISRVLQNRVALARLTEGPPLVREWVTLEELVTSALVRAGEQQGERPVELAIGADVVAHVDARLTELLISNLVDNAIRYAGGAFAIAGRRDERAIEIDVLDTGSSGNVVTFPPGHGLAISRAIAVAHGGTLDAIRWDGGTMLRARLPYGEPRPTFEDEAVEKANDG